MAHRGSDGTALIFMMLFVTFCKVRVRDLKFSMLQVWLMLFQLAATPLSYYPFLPFGEEMAQGAMVTFLMPIAMGAVAIGALLGANIATLASYVWCVISLSPLSSNLS